jgi:hypothetical protein
LNAHAALGQGFRDMFGTGPGSTLGTTLIENAHRWKFVVDDAGSFPEMGI